MPSSPTATATTRAPATAITWRPAPAPASCVHARRHPPADPRLRRAPGARRRHPQPASGRPRARLGPGAPGVPGRSVGGFRRLRPRPTAPARPSSRCCHCFITESTFGLPIYRWQPQAALFAEIDAWWRANQAAGRASVLFCCGAHPHPPWHRREHRPDPRPRRHGAAQPGLPRSRRRPAGNPLRRRHRPQRPTAAQALVMPRRRQHPDAPLRRLQRRLRQRLDDAPRHPRARRRGFVLSDADWPGLLWAIEQSGAERVFVTHGSVNVLVRYLSEQGLDAQAFSTEYGDEDEPASAPERPVKDFAELYGRLDASTSSNASCRRAAGLLRQRHARGRRLGGVLPQRWQAAPTGAGAPAGDHPGHHRPARMAVRGELPGGGRSRRNHFPAAATQRPALRRGPRHLGRGAPAAPARAAPAELAARPPPLAPEPAWCA